MSRSAVIRSIIWWSVVVLFSVGCWGPLSAASLPPGTSTTTKVPDPIQVITKNPLPTQTSPPERAGTPGSPVTPDPSPIGEANPDHRSCVPTNDDGVSPSYRSGMPVRTIVGYGHILRGTVRSSRDCAPIAGAVVEVWLEYAGLGHPDESRATLYTDGQGNYTYESDVPEHIHMRISANGYRTIGNNSYHPEEMNEGRFDIVLEPVE